MLLSLIVTGAMKKRTLLTFHAPNTIKKYDAHNATFHGTSH
jgi:hypothetical protein